MAVRATKYNLNKPLHQNTLKKSLFVRILGLFSVRPHRVEIRDFSHWKKTKSQSPHTQVKILFYFCILMQTGQLQQCTVTHNCQTNLFSIRSLTEQLWSVSTGFWLFSQTMWTISIWIIWQRNSTESTDTWSSSLLSLSLTLATLVIIFDRNILFKHHVNQITMQHAFLLVSIYLFLITCWNFYILPHHLQVSSVTLVVYYSQSDRLNSD